MLSVSHSSSLPLILLCTLAFLHLLAPAFLWQGLPCCLVKPALIRSFWKIRSPRKLVPPFLHPPPPPPHPSTSDWRCIYISTLKTLVSPSLGHNESEIRHTFYTFIGCLAFPVLFLLSTGVSWDHLQSKITCIWIFVSRSASWKTQAKIVKEWNGME